MKTLFICSKFTLDLTGKTLDWTEENPWFSEDPILNSTFPFEIDFEEIPELQEYKGHNAWNIETFYDGILQRSDGKITPARLELEEIESKLKGSIRDGLELFPSWNLKLTELDLGVVDVVDMLAHALTKVDQGYPSTTYNFPMIGALEIYKDTPGFENYFHGFYNKMNWEGNAFVPNIFDSEAGVYANHNIVYPMPYWLHILKRGVEQAGYTLHGDILDDEHFKKGIMPPVKVSIPEASPIIPLDTGFDMAETTGEFMHWRYQQEFVLAEHVKYRIKGKFLWLTRRNLPGIGMYNYMKSAKITFNGQTLFSITAGVELHQYSADFYIPAGAGGTLKIDAVYVLRDQPFQYDDIFTGNAIPTEVFDANGDPVIPIANFNKVDLAENLPELTYGELVKIVRKWKNYDFDLKDGKEVWMNLIDKEMVHTDPVDLSRYEVRFPNRKLEQTGSYLIKFSTENEEYPLAETFISLGAMQTENFRTDDNTTEITIDAIPLPIVPQAVIGDGSGPVMTAKIFGEEDQKPMLVLYEGRNEDNHNWTLPPDDLMTPVIADNYYFKFLQFRIKSTLYKWTMLGGRNEFDRLTRKSKIFAYNNYLVVKTLQRSKSKNSERIEIEAFIF